MGGGGGGLDILQSLMYELRFQEHSNPHQGTCLPIQETVVILCLVRDRLNIKVAPFTNAVDLTRFRFNSNVCT